MMAKVKRKKGRDYEQERKTAIARGETGAGSNSGDAKRHRARRKVIKARGPLRPDQVVDHKTRVKDGGGNDLSNLRVRSLSSNAADGGRVGNKEGKGKGKRRRSKK